MSPAAPSRTIGSGAAIGQDLLGLANADSGWPAVADRPSNTEATALATLALAGNPAAAAGRRWLIDTAQPTGGWGFTPEQPPSSWTTALAMLALRNEPTADDRVRAAMNWLIHDETVHIPWRVRLRSWLAPEEQLVELDYGVRGWPWASDTFGWVEPTAWALLALRAVGGARSSRAARARVADAVAMLEDRACVRGGWNYGNPRVMDTDLDPYPDTTALALLALGPDGSAADAVRQGFAALERMIDPTASGLSCALAALCQRAHGRDPSRALDLLVTRYELTGFLGETRVLALALLALDSAGTHRLAGPA